MKKNLAILFSVVLLITCLSVNNQVYADDRDAVDLKWCETIDTQGNIVQYLNMTDEEIEDYEISQLKSKYEDKLSRSGYTYEYTYISKLWETGYSTDDYILIGKYFSWGRRSSIYIDKTVKFGISGAYRNIKGISEISLSIKETIPFNSSYDNALGLFEAMSTTRYKVTQKDQYSGSVIATWYENVLTPLARTYRPIYVRSGTTISYQNGNSFVNAKMILNSLATPPTSNNHIVTATRSVFY